MNFITVYLVSVLSDALENQKIETLRKFLNAYLV